MNVYGALAILHSTKPKNKTNFSPVLPRTGKEFSSEKVMICFPHYKVRGEKQIWYVYINVYVYVNVYMYACVFKYVNVYMYACVFKYVYVYIYIYSEIRM